LLIETEEQVIEEHRSSMEVCPRVFSRN